MTSVWSFKDKTVSRNTFSLETTKQKSWHRDTTLVRNHSIEIVP